MEQSDFINLDLQKNIINRFYISMDICIYSIELQIIQRSVKQKIMNSQVIVDIDIKYH